MRDNEYIAQKEEYQRAINKAEAISNLLSNKDFRMCFSRKVLEREACNCLYKAANTFNTEDKTIFCNNALAFINIIQYIGALQEDGINAKHYLQDLENNYKPDNFN